MLHIIRDEFREGVLACEGVGRFATMRVRYTNYPVFDKLNIASHICD